MGWADHGFPYPTFYARYIPYRAMIKARRERIEIQSGTPPIGLAIPGYFETALSQYPLFDLYVTGYINQFLIASTNPSSILWSRADMVDAISGRDIYGIGELVDPDPQDSLVFGHDWPIKLLLRDKLNMDLLKLASMQYVRWVWGEGIGDLVSTPEDAYLSAISSIGTPIEEHLTTPFIRDLHKTEMYKAEFGQGYRCKVVRTFEVTTSNLNYPGSDGLPSNIHFSFSTEQAQSFDSYGYGLDNTPGVYHTIQLPYIMNSMAHPTVLPVPVDEGETLSANLYTHHALEPVVVPSLVSTNVSSLFEFYDNVDELTT